MSGELLGLECIPVRIEMISSSSYDPEKSSLHSEERGVVPGDVRGDARNGTQQAGFGGIARVGILRRSCADRLRRVAVICGLSKILPFNPNAHFSKTALWLFWLGRDCPFLAQ